MFQSHVIMCDFVYSKKGHGRLQNYKLYLTDNMNSEISELDHVIMGRN